MLCSVPQHPKWNTFGSIPAKSGTRSSILECSPSIPDHQCRLSICRCNTSIVYGVRFINLKGLELYGGDKRQALWQGADRCCCKDYKGELFDFTCTISTAWNVSWTGEWLPVRACGLTNGPYIEPFTLLTETRLNLT